MGECGLDFNRNFSPPQAQLKVFEKQVSETFAALPLPHTLIDILQLQLACELQKPLFLHERDAHGEMVNLLEPYKNKLPGCIIHCFTGNKDEAQKYLDLGCHIGLTGKTDGLQTPGSPESTG